jgi:GH15 family glucan-1,4-alpha-glucosidase
MTARIEDYALIGDCETAALVSRDGSIDWLCLPRFDSAACFAALLGGPQHGRWQLAPAEPTRRVTRRYRDDTLVLETDFETASGAATIIDFMTPHDSTSDLVRIVVGRSGHVALRTELVIRFDYGATVPWVSRLEDGTLRAIAGPDMLVLRATIDVRGEGLKTVGEFAVRAGERVAFVLTHAASHLPVPPPIDAEAALAATEKSWAEWAARCSVAGEWSGTVKRSLITLKALSYAPTGGILAAPTTSLPERLGGVRNWDYRFCWLRDSTFTLLALMGGGYYDEAQSWRDWLLRAVAGSPDQMQIVYGLAGERSLPERALPWLPGYEGAQPVRVGNAAAEQFQIDVFGEVMDMLHQARKGGLAPSPAGWSLERALLGHLAAVWDQPDHGIWEVRGGPRHFTHSKVMAWVAFDRAVKSVETFKLEGAYEDWRKLAARIHADVCRNAWRDDLGSFVQSYGSDELDASLLLIPLVGFLPPEDPRVRATVAAIEQRLTVDGLVLRYDTRRAADGLPPGEGVFLPCSFWLADNLILQGEHARARTLFERLCACANDVGLLAEEYDPRTRRMLGNFPQAFTHVALTNTALNLSRARGPAEARSEPSAAASRQAPEPIAGS